VSHLCKEKENERTMHGCTDDPSRQIEKEARHVRHSQELVSTVCVIIAFLIVGCDGRGGENVGPTLFAAIAPTTYSAYTGTDAKQIPQAPALGPANSIIQDPTFGSRILRVTDALTNSGDSLIPEYAGYFRTWNANSTALKLHGPHGTSYWLEFESSSFSIGDGSTRPTLHPLSFDVKWEWSAVDPDIIYFINGNQLAKYNKATQEVTNLGPPQSVPLGYHALVVGADDWICSAAGSAGQNTYTQIYCLNPHDPSQHKFIDILKKTINGIAQHDPHWPTSAAGQTIGIHAMYGSAAGAWLDVGFVHHSWGANGDSVFNLSTNTWSLMTNANMYSSGHSSIGAKFVNGCGSINGMYSGGACLRDPSNLMDATQYTFIMQPPSTATGWHDGEHSSWFNASTNPEAPVLFSRYNISTPPSPVPWYGEIIAAATDGSNTVWRFAHNHNGGLVGSYTGQSFAQISNDGRWALFSSPWDGTLGPSSGDFDYPTRLDTFIVELK
jgi:hypothetical protein